MANVLRRMEWSAMSPDQRDALCRRGLDDIFDPVLRESIGALIEDVRVRGDLAVCDALARFDGISLRPDQLRVTQAEIESATIDPAVEAAIIDAISHLRAFNDELMERASDWQIEIENGLVAGEKISPIASVGLFVPSGKASYPSVAYQLGVPAMVAGVPNVVLIVPPVPGGTGEVDPAVLVVCRLLGITNVFRINGPAGIAALGFGTESIPRVRKVVGPGSPAVTIAQVEMQRHGLATMMLLGPTESLVLTDHTADPVRLAADLLIEAEHGTDSTVVLVTPSAELVDLVDDELERQLADLPQVRADAARASLGVNGGAVITANMNDAVDVANTFAAEHLQVIVDPRHEEAVVDALVNAGEILVGQDTPFSAANFVIGCPASLPTSGFAHVSSGITVEAFLKRTAVARANESALRRMSRSIISLADHEGFPAHGNAIRRRFG
ncbi:MAG: histidinol dehydrogenase [Actinomycetota bacterium]